MYKLSTRSLSKLNGVDAGLVNVVKRAIEITDVDFAVTEGLRSIDRQQELFDSGASQTLESKHLYGLAVDLAAYNKDGISWHWPLYERIAVAMKEAAYELDVGIIWGGDWTTFKDGCHFELSGGS